MNLTDNEVLKFMRGSPIILDDVCVIRSVKLGEIVDLGYDKFSEYLSTLTMEKPIMDTNADDETKELLESLTDFQYLLMLATMDVKINSLTSDLILSKLFFSIIHTSQIISS